MYKEDTPNVDIGLFDGFCFEDKILTMTKRTTIS